MLDLASVEGVVEDAPDRSGGKQPGLGYRITFACRMLVAVTGSEALGVETGSQLGKGGQTRGVAVEQPLNRGMVLAEMGAFSPRRPRRTKSKSPWARPWR